MKRITFLLIVAMFSFTAYTTNAQAKLTEGEEKFIQTITKDFVDTHSISLNDYNFFDIRKIDPNKDNLTSQEKSIINIFMNISKKQNLVDCSPIFFIDKTNTKGYVLEKKLRGTNSLYILSYDSTSQNWKVKNKINKMGKDLNELGLLKGNE